MSETTDMDKLNFGFGFSLAIIAILNALLTVGKEEISAVKDFAVSIGSLVGISHHWVGHGILMILLFIVLGFVFSQATISDYLIQKFSFDQRRLLLLIVISVIIGIGIIGGFFFMLAFLG